MIKQHESYLEESVDSNSIIQSNLIQMYKEKCQDPKTSQKRVPSHFTNTQICIKANIEIRFCLLDDQPLSSLNLEFSDSADSFSWTRSLSLQRAVP